MQCTQCGGDVEMTDESGGTTEGPFEEEYQCVNCEATGYISGDAGSSPAEWDMSGRVFE